MPESNEEVDETSETVNDTEAVDDGTGVAKHEPYKERDDWVPSPLHQTGHVDTTGTGGDLAGRIEEISPVFAQGRANALRAAVNAVENDPGTSPQGVILPTEGRTVDDAVAELKAAADAAENAPQLTSGLSPAQEEAAEPGEPVNPNAIRSDDHDLSAEGATAPPAGQTIISDGDPSNTGHGVPNVNPNAESLDAADNGLDAPVVFDPVDDGGDKVNDGDPIVAGDPNPPLSAARVDDTASAGNDAGEVDEV